MSAKNLSIFVPINKIDEEQRLVYGQVAAEVVDNSGEVFDYDASKPYFQKWSENAHITSGGKSKGNLRVMHTSKVAGIVTDLGFDDENRVIEACAKVIDDNEWNMVKAGAYTGFSMGGRYVSRAEKADSNGKTTKTYVADPVEISLVDKPCIPTAVFSVVKADGIVEQRHFSETVQSEDGIDLEKASGPSRHPKGSGKGGQFAPGKGGGSSGGGSWKDAPMTTGFVNGKGSPKEQIDREVKRRVRLASKDEKNGHGSKSEQLRSIAKEDRRIASSRMEVAASKAKAGDTAGAARMAGNAKFYNQLADATEAKAGAAKFDDGDLMYVPTNDEILPVARALAKAAGRSEEDWLEFSDQARENLIAKADGKMAKAEEEEDDDKAPDMGEPGEDDESGEEEEDVEKKDGPPPAVKDKMKDKEDDEEEDDDDAEEEDSKAEKSDEPDVEQGWRAKDGTFFAKKADALAHNETLKKADEPSLVDQLQNIAKNVERIAKGEVEVEGAEAEDVAAKSDIEEMADALDTILKVDHGGTLQKSMYTVERTARALRELASINIMVAKEQKREGRESTLPESLNAAVSQLGTTLVDMAKEEVEELMECVANCGEKTVSEPYYGEYMALAAPILGLAKADLEAKIGEALQKRDPDELPAEALQKIDAAKAETAEALAKAARLEGEMAEIAPLVKSLQAQVQTILNSPMPKAPTTVVVGKGEQVEKADDSQTVDLNKFTPDQLADAALRMAHQRPVHIAIPAPRS